MKKAEGRRQNYEVKNAFRFDFWLLFRFLNSYFLILNFLRKPLPFKPLWCRKTSVFRSVVKFLIHAPKVPGSRSSRGYFVVYPVFHNLSGHP